MSNQLKGVIELALECVENVAALVSHEKLKEVAKKFRSRAREVPAYVFTHGFVYTITLLAARSSKTLIEYGFTQSRTCSEVVTSVISQKGSLEELGYGLYGAVLIYIISKAGFSKSKNFEELVKESLNNSILDAKAKYTLEWIRRFAEAYIEAE